MRIPKLLGFVIIMAMIAPSSAQPVLTGTTALACSAILCLSTSASYPACGPALDHYFGIKHEYLTDTINARFNFLNLCPSASADGNMSSLVRAISRGGGQCDVRTLNANTRRTANDSEVISDSLPSHCADYWNHSYTVIDNMAQYVGIPERGGYWVEPQHYAEELAKYQARIEYEDRVQEQSNWGGN